MNDVMLMIELTKGIPWQMETLIKVTQGVRSGSKSHAGKGDCRRKVRRLRLKEGTEAQPKRDCVSKLQRVGPGRWMCETHSRM